MELPIVNHQDYEAKLNDDNNANFNPLVVNAKSMNIKITI